MNYVKHSTTERQTFLHLLALIIEDLPTSAIDAAVRAGYEDSTAMLGNVRIGRVMNCSHLMALIGYGLPSYTIPAELLPTQKVARG